MTKIALRGVSLHYELSGKGAPCLVLLHGLGGTLHDFDYIYEGMADKFQILRMDLRGFGQSDKPYFPEYSTKIWAKDLQLLMNALEISEGILCGHSMGARVAVHFAQLFPKMVKALILMDMTFWGANPKGGDELELLSEKVLKKGMEVALDLIPTFSHTSPEERLKNELLKNDPKAFSLGLRSVAQDYRSSPSFLEKISCPSLILSGYLEESGGGELKKCLPGSKREIIPDCNHYSMLDQPQGVEENISQFISSIFV